VVNLECWKEKAKSLKNEVFAIYLAYRNPRTPWYAKVFIAVIIGYALSPIDLIPDFIPVLGYVDDFIVIPAAISFAITMIPEDVMKECRENAKSESLSTRKRWVVAVIIVLIWLLAVYIVVNVLWHFIF